MFVSVTRLRVRRFIDLPVFLWKTQLAKRQVIRVPGFLGGKLLVDGHRTYWTLTVWESDRAMKAYRGSGAHSGVMLDLSSGVMRRLYALGIGGCHGSKLAGGL